MIEELLRNRRSVRAFRNDPVPKEIIERIIAAGALAPSASNKQPWRFFVVTSKTKIVAMANAVKVAVDRIAKHVEPGAEVPFRSYGDYFTRFENAPVVIAPLFQSMSVLSNLVGGSIDEADHRRIVQMEQNSGIISASLAVQNMLLVTHELGLGASMLTGPLVAEDVLRVELRIPSSWALLGLIALGYPAEIPQMPQRKTVEKITRWFEDDVSEDKLVEGKKNDSLRRIAT